MPLSLVHLRGPRTPSCLVLAVVLGTAACGGGSSTAVGDGKGPPTLEDPATTSGDTGIDLTGWVAVGAAGPAGGTVELAGALAVMVPAGALAASVQVGLRPSVSSPSLPAGWQAASSWTDVALSRVGVRVVAGTEAPIRLEFAATPPAGSEAHPGLQLLAVVHGIQIPVDGAWDPASGRFVVEALALPAEFTCAVVLNPAGQALADDVVATRIQAGLSPAGGSGWRTQKWVIAYDSQVITKAQALTLRGFAEEAARTYDTFGFKEPALYSGPNGVAPRWRVHLVPKRSHYSHADAAGTGEELFGRLYIDVTRLDAAAGDPVGGRDHVTHELFHAVYLSYGVENQYLAYTNLSGEQALLATDHGYNEGMATAVGRFLAHGEATPRPDQSPSQLWLPFGHIDTNDLSAAYRNQDFYVYLLRVAPSLDYIRSHVEALATTSLAGLGNLRADLSAYAAALGPSAIGLAPQFAQVYGQYVADRSYERHANGNIWPAEPAAAPGKPGVLALELFDPWYETLASRYCKLDESGSVTTCAKVVAAVWPLAAYVMRVRLEDVLPSGAFDGPVTAVVEVTTPTAGSQVFVWAYAAKDWQGIPMGTGATGAGGTIPNVNKAFPEVFAIALSSQGAPTDVTFKFRFFTQAVEPPKDVVEADPGAEVEPWTDPVGGRVWTKYVSPEGSDQAGAAAWCDGLGGGWRMPTIDELRTLISGCPAVATGGACKVSTSCNSSEPTCYDGNCQCDGGEWEPRCMGCPGTGGGPADGCFNDPTLPLANGLYCATLWSSTTFTGSSGEPESWYIELGGPSLSYGGADWRAWARCTR